MKHDWSIVARNLPEHANNPIHTDAGARAAGFERALVAGVTTYAYCLHVPLSMYGLGFAERGETEVRFRSPVFDGDQLSFEVSNGVEGLTVGAMSARTDRLHVSVDARKVRRNSADVVRSGERLEPVTIDLVGEYSSQYGVGAGDDFDMGGYVHPAVWPALGNYVFHRQLARGSWIHTRSIVRHFALVSDGATATVEATVVDRFLRGGERAVADVAIKVGGQTVAIIEHEAIIDLQASTGNTMNA